MKGIRSDLKQEKAYEQQIEKYRTLIPSFLM